MQEAVDVQRRSAFPDENRLARNIYNLSSAYIAAGELARAKPLLAESMAMHLRLVGAEHEVIGLHYAAQANLAKAEGRWSEAQALQEQALANYRRSVGPAHPSIAAALRDLAKLVEHNGSQPGAIAALQEADAMAQKVFAVELPHPTLAAIRSDLLAVVRRAGRADEADALERAGFSGGPVGAGPLTSVRVRDATGTGGFSSPSSPAQEKGRPRREPP